MTKREDKTPYMTAEEFIEAQAFFGHTNREMADYMDKSERYVNNARSQGVYDKWLAMGIRIMIRNEQMNRDAICLTKSCGGKPEQGKAYCAYCLAERAEANK